MSAQPNDEQMHDLLIEMGIKDGAKLPSANALRSIIINVAKKYRTYTLQAQQYTRLEVIDHTDQGTGREYSKWVATPFTVKFDEQDDGRTLKIFLEDGVPSND